MAIDFDSNQLPSRKEREELQIAQELKMSPRDWRHCKQSKERKRAAGIQ
jgi:hypothetical protein